MGVLTDLPIRQVFKHARRMRPEDKTPSRSNLCEAQQRLAVEPVRRVFDLVVKPLATPQTLGGFYHDLRLMGIDGTVLDVPDTPANNAHFWPEQWRPWQQHLPASPQGQPGGTGYAC